MKGINRFIIFIGLFLLDVLYSSIIVAILKEIGINISDLSLLNKSFLLITIDITFMLIIYFIYRKEINNEFVKYLKNFGKFFKFGLKFWIIGLLLMCVSNFIIGLFVPAGALNEALIQDALVKMPVYLVFSTVIFAPFVEELIFRKCLRKVFNSDIIFILASGFLFGLVHSLTGIGTLQMLYIIPYGIFGALFAYIYVKTNNIWVSMTFHFIHNSLLIGFSLIASGVI